jgi:cystathionine beta-lyase/cystathionine gamma-synthase
VAALLHSSPEVSSVLYPGLEDHVTHAAARDLTGGRGYGAIVTFDLRGDTPDEKRARRDRFIAAVFPEIRLIPTLGDARTILMPVESVWGVKYPEPGLIRMSMGFEPGDEILEVVRRGLKS